VRSTLRQRHDAAARRCGINGSAAQPLTLPAMQMYAKPGRSAGPRPGVDRGSRALRRCYVLTGTATLVIGARDMHEGRVDGGSARSGRFPLVDESNC
jgi:hypothetical protein